MHPNPKFAWKDEAAMRAFVAETAFAQIVSVADGRPISAQAPLTFGLDGSVRFHLSRANRLVAILDGAPVLASVIGNHAYISPDWYGTADQVPTWNYRLVEIEGVARRLDEAELRDQIDRLSATQEARLAPKPAWTSAKMTPARLDAMVRAIVGFAIDAPRFGGAIKMGQNRTDAEAAGAIAALRAIGNHALADEMEAAR
ncbi:MAG TPA: FMN-binding negative transcriptional regulator [Sphingomonas sp.]|uniref:FMN-binding negative transcriptional regulator n=1 Tax=Sphingomonas sp. TaxID=28214 RepID=UPI002BC08824|nr:FMN-binding negative transcriptional regulator [Sphingomonas sp.]HMI17970.1 FMN-binding negative transcriptional regulator [Sphingomonas sp.]